MKCTYCNLTLYSITLSENVHIQLVVIDFVLYCLFMANIRPIDIDLNMNYLLNCLPLTLFTMF